MIWHEKSKKWCHLTQKNEAKTTIEHYNEKNAGRVPAFLIRLGPLDRLVRWTGGGGCSSPLELSRAAAWQAAPGQLGAPPAGRQHQVHRPGGPPPPAAVAPSAPRRRATASPPAPSPLKLAPSYMILVVQSSTFQTSVTKSS